MTSPDDEETPEVVRSVPGARLFVTDAFTRPDSKGVKPLFNKGHAIQLAFDELGRSGFVVVWDSDCLWPDSLPLDQIQPGFLHGAKRRILDDPSKWHPELNWNVAPPSRDGGAIGFFQGFFCDDPVLRNKAYWYDPSFAHGGGADAEFMTNWPSGRHKILPFDVLHLGPTDSHWFGVSPEAKDIMARFVTENGWHRAAAKFSPEQVARAGAFVERVEVPGFPKSSYELPFVRRSQAVRDRK